MKAWTGELTVFGVAVDGSTVRVDLVGGDQNICGSLLYEFEDETECERNFAVLGQWRDAGTQVLAFTDEDVVTLVDPQATVENLLAELSRREI
ncbi:MAG: hypothetical protein QOI95_1515 [Acidimicrobiaceae bacterium]|jgi:hypothetical protein